MRGHDELLDLRLSGYRAEIVWVMVLEGPALTDRWNDVKGSIEGGYPTIDVEPDDIPGLLDLRALHGATALIQGMNADRIEQVTRRAMEFRPARIIASTPEGIKKYRSKELDSAHKTNYS